MLFATLLLALMAQDDAGALRLEADRPVLVRGVPFRLTIRTDPSYSGVVHVKGLRGTASVDVKAGVGELRGAVAEGAVEGTGPGLRTARLAAPMIPGWLSLVPGLLAVGLALLTRQLLLSLFIGAWAGMLISGGLSAAAPVTSAVRVVDTLLLDVLTRPSYVTVVLFVVLLGGLIGLVVHSGGARGIADRLGRRMTKPKTAMLTTWALGVVLIIQDYASALLVGNTMRPLTDRVRISREKLAYLVDSTVAPMAAVGIFSAWALAEMRTIDLAPLFLSVIPYSFYAILALMLGAVVATSERDFGPMLAAERRASNTGLLVRLGGRPLSDRDATESEEVENMRDRWHNAVVPLAGAVVVTVTALFVAGAGSASRPEGSWIWEWPAYANPGRAVLWGILGGTVIAFVTVVARRHLDLRQAVDAWSRGARSVFMPLCLLALAWSLALVSRNLSLGEWLWSLLGGGSMAPKLAPALTFVAAAIASAVSGSSIASTAVLLPAAAALPDGDVRTAALAAVFSGAVFGRHVSPLGDTTIVASLGSACDHVDHVRTQAPYAALCAGAALLCGFLPAGFGVTPSLSLMFGAGVILAVFFLLARLRGEPTLWAAPATLDMPTQIPLPEEQTMS